LEQERLVEVGGVDDRGVRLGRGLIELAGAIRVDIVRLARPHLQALFDVVGETIDIAQTNGREVRFLDFIVSDKELRVVPGMGVRLPLHCMANGKAMLAGMSVAAVERLLGPELDRLTARSIGSLPELLEELEEVRRSGFAYDRQEHTEGVCAIGVGIAPLAGRMYAVSAAMPEQRFEAALPVVRPALLACKDGIELALRAALQSAG
jgi:DNA-binding IclR family transcriptional regulator